VLVFYEEEMNKRGWEEKKEGLFSKDKNLVNIVFHSVRDKGVKFSITCSYIPPAEKILEMRKEKPDKLIFMPVYPNSSQDFITTIPGGGMAAAYETSDNPKDVVFFYESGMLKYGWSLVKRVPVSGISDKVFLLFRRKEAEVCKIKIFKIPQVGSLSKNNVRGSKKKSGVFDETAIFVYYNVYKKNGR
jgi:hypothetical protein